MISPEVIDGDRVVMVHNHFIGSALAVELCASFTRARARFFRPHLPPSVLYIDVVFDFRGQHVSSDTRNALSAKRLKVRNVEILE
jgi:hypothetical protein